jgi:hypothetical protein
MKIQAHPDLPPMPFIFSIAAASKPERATESWDELQVKSVSLWIS